MAYTDADDSGELPLLRERVDRAWALWQGSPHRFAEVSELLPALVVDVQAMQRGMARSHEPEDMREAQKVAADRYFLLRTFRKRIGRTDLSLLVADRGCWRRRPPTIR